MGFVPAALAAGARDVSEFEVGERFDSEGLAHEALEALGDVDGVQTREKLRGNGRESLLEYHTNVLAPGPEECLSHFFRLDIFPGLAEGFAHRLQLLAPDGVRLTCF